MNTTINDKLYAEIECYLESLDYETNMSWPYEENCYDDYTGKFVGKYYKFLFIDDLNKFNEDDIIEVIEDNYGIYFDEKIKEYTSLDCEKERNIYFYKKGINLDIYIEVYY